MTAGESKYVTLTSSDDFSFVVDREACLVSATLRQMLSSGFSEAQTGHVTLESIDGVLLEMVCDYLYYHWRYKDSKDAPPHFEVQPEHALNLLVAADFLDGRFQLRTGLFGDNTDVPQSDDTADARPGTPRLVHRTVTTLTICSTTAMLLLYNSIVRSLSNCPHLSNAALSIALSSPISFSSRCSRCAVSLLSVALLLAPAALVSITPVSSPSAFCSSSSTSSSSS